MTYTPRTSRRPALRTIALTSLTVAATLLGCRADRTAVDPQLPGNPNSNPQIRSTAFIVDVNTRTKQVRITPPTNIPASPVVVSGAQSNPSFSAVGLDVPGPNFSIVAGDVVELSTSGFSASAVGAFQPGKVRVQFDVNISNRLNGVELITSTFPAPPAGTSGVVLFPYETVVTTTTGGTSTGGDGTEIIIELPSYGVVASSVDWDGTPHNFFNDTGCPAGANDCFRHEVFAQPLASGATSEARRVGFDIDPTVGNFRARLIVVADLRNSGPAPVGTVAGSVTSPQLGALSGVAIGVTPGSATGTTNGAGSYSIGSVGIGSRTVTITGGLPAGCTNPGPQVGTVTNGGTLTINFVVTCPVPAGTIGGTISSSLGGGIASATVTVTPNGQPAMASVSTNGSGVYSVAGVPVAGTGTGSIALGNLPAGCTDPGGIPYSGLTNGGSITVDVTVACAAPPAGYQYTNVWSAISGGQVTLTVRIDMGTYNDPAINGAGADDIEAIQGSIAYNPARLAFVSAGNVAGSGLQNGSFNGSTPGTVNFLNFTTLVALQTGNQGVAVITFNVLAGAPSSATTGTTLDVAASDSGADLIPRVIVNEGTLNIP